VRFSALQLLFAQCKHLRGEQRCLTSRGCPRFRSLKVSTCAFRPAARQAGKAQASRVGHIKSGGMGLKSGDGAERGLGSLVVLRLVQIDVGFAPTRITRLELQFPDALGVRVQPSLGSFLTLRARLRGGEICVRGLVETAFEDLEARSLKLWVLLDPEEQPGSSEVRSNHAAYIIGALLGTSAGEASGSLLSCEISSDAEGSGGESPRPISGDAAGCRMRT